MEMNHAENRNVAVTRMFTCIVTKEDALPGTPDCKESYWVVYNANGGIDLQETSVDMNLPERSFTTITIEDALTLLRTVKEKIMPDMSDMSGILSSIIHVEAVYNLDTKAIGTIMMTFPERFMAIRAFEESSKAPTRRSGYAKVHIMPPLKQKDETEVANETDVANETEVDKNNGDEGMPTPREV